MPVALEDIEQGATISFRSKDPTDLVVWRGVLESVGTYRSIRGLLDPRSYNARVRQSDPTVSEDVTDLTYFVITIKNQAEVESTQVFAKEWILPGSLIEISLAKQVVLRIDDPANDTQKILSILAEAGYASTIISQ